MGHSYFFFKVDHYAQELLDMGNAKNGSRGKGRFEIVDQIPGTTGTHYTEE